MSEEQLASYLDDHIAGSVWGIDLARRCARGNPSTPIGDYFESLVPLLEEDQATLKAVLHRLEGFEHVIKHGLAKMTEKVSGLRLSNPHDGEPHLSQVLSIEGLMAGSTGRLQLWSTLSQLQPHDPRLADWDFAALRDRTAEQLQELADLHARTVPLVFGGQRPDEAAEAA